jgi:hypothetical protein
MAFQWVASLALDEFHNGTNQVAGNDMCVDSDPNGFGLSMSARDNLVEYPGLPPRQAWSDLY